MPPRKTTKKAVIYTTNIAVALRENREETILTLNNHHKLTSEWLTQSFNGYKRRLIEIGDVPQGAPAEASKKKAKVEVDTLKENLHPVENKPTTKNTTTVAKPSKQTTKTIVPVTKSADVTSHPSYLKVMAMKVVTLRKELRSLGLETSGLKKELQKRLLQALVDKDNEQQLDKSNKSTNSHASSKQLGQTEKTKVFSVEVQKEDAPKVAAAKAKLFGNVVTGVDDDDDDDEDDVAMEDAQPVKDNKNDDTQANEEPKRMSIDSISEPPSSPKPHTVSRSDPPRSIVKTTAKLFSSNKITSKFQQPRGDEVEEGSKKITWEMNKGAMSPFASLKKTIVNTATSLLSPTRKAKQLQSATDQSTNASPAAATSKESTTKPPSSVASHQFEKPTVAPTPTHSSIKPSRIVPTPVGNVASSVKKIKERQQQLNEARRQRLADLRGKSKPIAAAGTPGGVKQTKINSVTWQKEPKKDDKRILLQAKMREKHAALQHHSGVPDVAKEKVATTPSWKTKLKKTDDEQELQPPPPKQQPQQPPVQPHSGVKKPVTHCLSPQGGNYQISDNEDDDDDSNSDFYSEEEEDDDKKPKKPIPSWAQKQNLNAALRKQYEKGSRFDPDIIFPEVETCDLEAIFDKKRSRYKKRTSSGNWTKDRVTVAEKLTYKRAMGYNNNSKSISTSLSK